ncbi:MAG: hypothetical protein QM621_08150 [Aeromicrobium sp.]|uniref:hypothetical protein n=1 Tax=Aeromicrobium sp. TaxID=1871063 RepID=UPI0039E3D683
MSVAVDGESVVVTGDPWPGEELDYPTAVERVAAGLRAHAWLRVETRAGRQVFVDEFVAPSSEDSAAPPLPATPAVAAAAELAAAAPAAVATAERVRRGVTRVLPPGRRRKRRAGTAVAAVAAALVVLVAGVPAAWSLLARDAPEPGSGAELLSPALVDVGQRAGLGEEAWQAAVDPAATVVATSAGVVVTGDGRWRVVASDGTASAALALPGTPELVAEARVDGEHVLVAQAGGRLLWWSPGTPEAWAGSVGLPAGAAVSTDAGGLLVVAGLEAFTLVDGRLVDVAVPAGTTPVALTPDGELMAFEPPARLVVGGEPVTLSAPSAAAEDHARPRVVAVTGPAVMVAWAGGSSGRAWLAGHAVEDGEAEWLAEVGGRTAAEGVWRRAGDRSVAVFGDLVLAPDGRPTARLESAGLVLGVRPGLVLADADGAGVAVTAQGVPVEASSGAVGLVDGLLVTRSQGSLTAWRFEDFDGTREGTEDEK